MKPVALFFSSYFIPFWAFLFLLPAFAQQPTIEWQRTFGGSEADDWQDLTATPDGGYMAIGSTNSSDGDVKGHKGKSDIWLAKMALDGTIVWQKCLGGTESDVAHSILRLRGGGYLLVAGTRSSDGDLEGKKPTGTDAWLVQINEAGDILWQAVYGSDGTDVLYTAIQTAEGNFVLAGQRGTPSGTDADVWVLVVDKLGQKRAENTYGGSSFDRANALIATKDGGYLVVGQTNSKDRDVHVNAGGGDSWAIKIDASLALKWERSYGKGGMDVATSAVQMPDGGYLIAGNSQTVEPGKSVYEGEIDGIVVKLSPKGEVEWERRLGGGDHEMLNRMIATQTGGFLVTGWFGEGRADHDMAAWVAELNESGDIRWQEKLSGNGGGSFNGMSETSKGEYTLVGWTRASRAARNQAWSVRFSRNIRMKAIVRDSVSGKPIFAEVSFIPFGKDGFLQPTVTPEGSFEQILAVGKYQLNIRKAGYKDYRELLEIVQRPDNLRERGFLLAPLKTGERATLNRIYFEQQKATLTSASFTELDKVAAFLKERPSVRIMIEGHTASGSREDLNQILSQQRAQAVLAYLVQKGIAPKRLEAVGYGSARPAFDNDSDEGRGKNRRIEFVILGE